MIRASNNVQYSLIKSTLRHSDRSWANYGLGTVSPACSRTDEYRGRSNQDWVDQIVTDVHRYCILLYLPRSSWYWLEDFSGILPSWLWASNNLQYLILRNRLNLDIVISVIHYQCKPVSYWFVLYTQARQAWSPSSLQAALHSMHFFCGVTSHVEYSHWQSCDLLVKNIMCSQCACYWPCDFCRMILHTNFTFAEWYFWTHFY